MSEGNDERPLQVRIPLELRQRFKIVCTQQERSMSDVLREFIEWYTAKKEEAA